MKTGREKKLMIGVLCAAAIYLAVSFHDSEAISGSWLTVFQPGGSEFQELLEENERYQEILRRRKQIDAAFKEIEAPYQVAPGLTPEKSFMEKISALCRKHQLRPQIDVPQIDDLRDVDEYGLILVEVTSSGLFPNFVNLMKELNSQGFLIQNLDARTATDNPTIIMNFTVARPAKLSELRSFRHRG